MKREVPPRSVSMLYPVAQVAVGPANRGRQSTASSVVCLPLQDALLSLDRRCSVWRQTEVQAPTRRSCLWVSLVLRCHGDEAGGRSRPPRSRTAPGLQLAQSNDVLGARPGRQELSARATQSTYRML